MCLRNAALTAAGVAAATAASALSLKVHVRPTWSCCTRAAATLASCERLRRRRFSTMALPSSTSASVKPSRATRSEPSFERRGESRAILRGKDREHVQGGVGLEGIPADVRSTRRSSGRRARGCASTGATSRLRPAGSVATLVAPNSLLSSLIDSARSPNSAALALSGVSTVTTVGAFLTSGSGTRAYGAAFCHVPKRVLEHLARRVDVEVADDRDLADAADELRGESGAGPRRSSCCTSAIDSSIVGT